MGKTIHDLSQADQLAPDDEFPLWDASARGTRRAQMSMLADMASADLAGEDGADKIGGTWFGGFQAPLSSLGGGAGSSLIGYALSAIGALPRSAQNKLEERVTPQDFMSEEQRMDVYLRIGNVDVSYAIQAALDHLNSLGGGCLYLPAGRYRKADTSPGLKMYSNITIRGDGDASVLFHDDRATNPRRDLLAANNCDNIAFESFQIAGTLKTYTNETNMSQSLTGSNIVGLRVQNVTFRELRYMATAFNYVRGGLFLGCRFFDIQRDGARCTGSQDVRVIGCQFVRVADDAVALHSIDATAPPSSAGVDWATVPVPSSFVVSDNNFLACQSIKLLGGKVVVIKNNTMRYMIRGAVLVSNTSTLPEGNTPVFSLDISGNTIIDTIGNRGWDRVISVTLRARSKGALSTQPGVNAPTFDYNFGNDIDVAGSINPGACAIRISNNMIGWASKRGVAFSSYGYGLILDRPSAPTAGFIDPVMTDAEYSAYGIYVDGPVRSLEVSGNHLWGGGATLAAISLGASSDTANIIPADGVRVERNTVSDWPVGGAIRIDYGAADAGAHYVSVKNNHLNLDPFFRAASHNADNTWSTDTGVVGFAFNSRRYLGEFSGNHLRNMGKVVDTPSSIMTVPLSNFAYYTPSGLGLDGNASNKGIRTVPASSQYVSVTIDGTPTSPTFGSAVSGIPVLVAGSMPTTGAYTYGHVVQASVPILGGGAGTQYMVRGWLRRTTGTSHVLNTDWTELRMLTGN